MVPRVADRDLLEAGAREAAEAIMRLSHRESARMVAAGAEGVPAVIERAGPRAVVVSFTVKGALDGRFAVVLSETGARALAGDMIGGKAAHSATDKLGRRVQAALTEMGNIAASAFMNGAAELLRAACVPSVPSLTFGDAAAIIPTALNGAGEVLVVRLVVGDVSVDLALAR